VLPLPCGTCIAYLRASGLEVTEERLDAVNAIMAICVVASARYLPVVERDSEGQFAFQMPPMCAMCGSADAPHLRRIENRNRGAYDSGLQDVVTSELTYTGLPGRRGSGAKQSQGDLLDDGLRGLKVPVCVNHTSPVSPLYPPLEYNSGALVIASYRYYRALCTLNRII